MAVNEFGVEMDQYATDRYTKNTGTTTTNQVGNESNVSDIVGSISKENDGGLFQKLFSKGKNKAQNMLDKIQSSSGEWDTVDNQAPEAVSESQMDSMLKHAMANLAEEDEASMYDVPMMDSSKKGLDYDGF
tara:strand:+ start:511 stop:903 length:393 start_codon:yes stop_codon:yes gene_type:complete